jgi:glycosyltransferase involved in cell wall biosynthesis
MKVNIISLTGYTCEYFSEEIAPNLREIRVPKSKNQTNKELEMAKKYNLTRDEIFDFAQILHFEQTPEFIKAFIENSENSDFIVSSQPFFYPMIKKYSNKKLIHDSHNIEYLLKKQLLEKKQNIDGLLNLIFLTEKEISNNAEFNIVCTATDDDIKSLNHLYGTDKNKIYSIPNGVDLEGIKFISPEERNLNKKRSGSTKKTALFMGSTHPPNLEACEQIFKFAKNLKDVDFCIVGTACKCYENRTLPSNVLFLGIVSNEEKNKLLSTVDVALNPIFKGAGTNMKMLDYMAAGIPVITTPIGIRGLDIDEKMVEIAEIDGFEEKIKIINFDKIYKAREHVEKVFDWQIIAAKYRELLFSDN